MSQQDIDAQAQAVVRAVARFDSAEFEAYGGGWPNDIGLALVDAVHSIRARYHSNTPGTGVYHRLCAFKEAHPGATNDLRALTEVGADELRRIMGNTKTARRYKADCVMDAAHAFLSLEPPVTTAADARQQHDAKTLEQTYASVRGLGRVTAPYFRMLLGAQAVKPDIMVTRFVNAALALGGHDPVNDQDVSRIVATAHAVSSHGVGLTAYEHAIWRAKGVVPAMS